MRQLFVRLQQLPLSQQLALTASACCLAATLLLVALATTSSNHTQNILQAAYGEAVAEQLALRLGTELATGDRLGVASELARLIEQKGIQGARAVDIEGAELAAAGTRDTAAPQFKWPIQIAGDIAGSAEVYLNTETQHHTQQRFVLLMSGLALLLSIVIFGITRAMGQRLARNLQAVSAELAKVTGQHVTPENELQALRDRVAALPLDLLRPSALVTASDEHYQGTTIVYLYLRSLPSYLETIDERRLQRYVATLHRMIYGAVGFYNGDLAVARQFGLAIYFTEHNTIGSPALRAASCAWLIQQTAPVIGEQLRLSVNLGIAVGHSELGPGDHRDIYPGLYTQSSLDRLHRVCQQEREGIALVDAIGDDLDLQNRATILTPGNDRKLLGSWVDSHRDLVERQRQILLRALIDNAPQTDDAKLSEEPTAP